MNPIRRSDSSFPYYPSQEVEKTRGRIETRASAAQDSGRFRAVHFSCARLSTSAPYRDRSPLERNRYDRFLKRLNDVFIEVDLMGDRYSGDLHARLIKQLYEDTHGDISVNKKIEYINALHSSIHSFNNWSIEAAIVFYRNLTNMNFFADIHKFNDSSKAKAEELHNELISMMTEKFSSLGAIGEHNLCFYTGLFWALSNSDFIKNSWKNRLVAKNLVEKMANAFLSYQKLLSSHFYKEVINYISRLNKIDEYKNIFKVLIEKHLIEIGMLDNKKGMNVKFAKYLTSFLNAVEDPFTLISLEKYIEKLIIKIDCSNCIDDAYLGLRSITTYLSNSGLPISEVIYEKIEECLSCIGKSKANFRIGISHNVAYSISFLFSRLENISDEYLEIFNVCIKSLEKNKCKLTLEDLSNLLILVDNLSLANVPFLEVIELAAYVFVNKYNDFYTLPRIYLHDFFCEFGIVSKAMKNKKQYASIKAMFSALVSDLTISYSQYLLSAELPEQINGYRSLSIIATSDFLSNASVRNVLRDLFDAVDKNEKFLDLSNNDVSAFLNATMKLGDFIKLDLDKYTEIFISHTKKIIENKEAEADRSLMLWAILVFFVTNRKQLDRDNQKKLKKVIKKLYLKLKNADYKANNSTLSMAEFWLKIARPERCMQESDTSFSQSRVLKKLQEQFRNERFETEVSIKNLPPCDILIPSRDIVIEVLGSHHFLDSDNRYKTGSTLLKLESYRKAGFNVMEVYEDEDDAKETQAVDNCIKEICEIVGKPRFS